MTTIAWDGRFLAADTLMVAGSYRCPQHVDKLAIHGGRVFGITGAYGWAKAIVDWVTKHGADPVLHPLIGHTAPEGCNLPLIIEVGAAGAPARSFEGSCPYPVLVANPEAWGSGAEYAIGAMMWGATAPEAVALAIKANPHTGGYVRFVDTHRTPLVIQEWRDHEGWHQNRSQRHGRPDFEAMPELGRGAPPALIARPAPPAGIWGMECDLGRLFDGGGCGICKRCNREWFALREYALAEEITTDDQGRQTGIVATARFRAAVKGCGCVAPTSPPIHGDAPFKRDRWEAWLSEYNNAVRDGCELTAAMLRDEQRELVLPPGVAIVEDLIRPPGALGFYMFAARAAGSVTDAPTRPRSA